MISGRGVGEPPPQYASRHASNKHARAHSSNINPDYRFPPNPVKAILNASRTTVTFRPRVPRVCVPAAPCLMCPLQPIAPAPSPPSPLTPLTPFTPPILDLPPPSLMIAYRNTSEATHASPHPRTTRRQQNPTRHPRVEPASNAMTWIIVAVIVVAILLMAFKSSKRNASIDQQNS